MPCQLLLAYNSVLKKICHRQRGWSARRTSLATLRRPERGRACVYLPMCEWGVRASCAVERRPRRAGPANGHRPIDNTRGGGGQRSARVILRFPSSHRWSVWGGGFFLLHFFGRARQVYKAGPPTLQSLLYRVVKSYERWISLKIYLPRYLRILLYFDRFRPLLNLIVSWLTLGTIFVLTVK